MRRLLATLAMALILFGPMTTMAFAGGYQFAASENDAPGEGPKPAPTEEPNEDEEPFVFDSLWLLLVGAIGVLLLIRLMRTEWDWHRRPDDGRKSRNELPCTDVLTDE